MSPAGLAFLGAGSFIQGQAKYDSLMDQAQAEAANASFYRTQADFAQRSGDLKDAEFDTESQIQFGEQESGFAKAGFDTSNSSFFMATQMLQRQKGYESIKADTQMNVMLASERADAATKTAGEYDAAAQTSEMGSFIQTGAMAVAFL